mgnify:CR=1 FL=1
MWTQRFAMTATASLVLLLSACAPPLDAEADTADAETVEEAPVAQAPAPQRAAPEPTQAPCYDCGVVASIEPITEKGQGSGVGAIAGAVMGGVIGHQFGSGSGNKAATAAGAIGGAMAGNEVEKRRNSTTYCPVTVSMDEGGSRTVNVGSAAGISVGTPVRVVGDNLELRT